MPAQGQGQDGTEDGVRETVRLRSGQSPGECKGWGDGMVWAHKDAQAQVPVQLFGHRLPRSGRRADLFNPPMASEVRQVGKHVTLARGCGQAHTRAKGSSGKITAQITVCIKIT